MAALFDRFVQLREQAGGRGDLAGAGPAFQRKVGSAGEQHPHDAGERRDPVEGRRDQAFGVRGGLERVVFFFDRTVFAVLPAGAAPVLGGARGQWVVQFSGLEPHRLVRGREDGLVDPLAPPCLAAFGRCFHRPRGEAGRHRPAFAPGARTEYADSNYLLLGAILERASCEPAGEAGDRPLSDYPEVAWTAGAMVSTIGNLRIYGRALTTGGQRLHRDDVRPRTRCPDRRRRQPLVELVDPTMSIFGAIAQHLYLESPAG
ncbi:MAG: hypothetical protein BGO11_02545 [Solirubrobacterales bacterium 70-9]|nr:MAG: hypothetical protein BGO11_02545 [Solirubrobacterales bacterium 70-9]